MKTYTTTLAIGGSDPSGGAGIQADLKTFSALGCYGMSAITALTAQNTTGVRGIFEVSPEFVESQLNAIFEDIEVDAVKIGMLHSPAIIETVARCLDNHPVKQLVLDPVMFAKSGDRLIKDDAIETLRERLIPKATVLTPNLPEAGELLRRSIKTREHMEESAHTLLGFGPECVVIKGGHIDFGGSDDFMAFLSGKEIEDRWFYGRRETTSNLHGTGCTFASAVTAYLAKGLGLTKAVKSAKEYIAGAVKAGGEYSLGNGHGPVSHFYQVWEEEEGKKLMKFSKEAWDAVTPLYQKILKHPFNLELSEGTLEKSRFQFYMKQDSLYLVDFARALAIAASKAETPEDIVLLLDFSKGAIVAERGLHQHYFELFDIQLDIEKAPGCFSYTNFLISTCTHKSFAEGIAALLPCFWIYREVGLHIHSRASAENPYQKWIDTYSGDEFSKIVDDAIDLTDRVAEKVNPQQRGNMLTAFVLSTRLEWMFWDSAYREEPWH